MPTPKFKKGHGGRPKGTSNKIPSKREMYEGLAQFGFDWFKEWIAIYRSAEAEVDLKANMLSKIAPYLFAPRRPEDSAGQVQEGPSVIAVSPELMAEIEAIKNSKGDR